MYKHLHRRGVLAVPGTLLLILTASQAGAERLDATEQQGDHATVEEIRVEGERPTSLRGEAASAATLIEAQLRELPFNMSVITRGLIETVNTSTTREMIEQSASVVTGSVHSRTFQSIFIRGFSAQSEINGALKNGIPFYGVDSPVADPSALERIEVLKGSTGLLFGSAEPGGVINYVYRQPEDELSLDIQATLGEYDTRRGEIDATGPVPGVEAVTWRFTLGLEDSESWQDYDYLEKAAPTLQLRAQVAENTSISILAERIDLDTNPINADTTVANGEIVELDIDTYLGHENDYSEERTEQVQVSLNHRFTDSLSLMAQLGWNTTKRDMGATGYWSFFGPPRPDGTMFRLVFDQRRQSDGDYAALHLTWDQTLGNFRHRALLGVNASKNNMRNNNAFSLLLPPAYQAPVSPVNIYNPVPGTYPHRTDFEDSPPYAILDWTYRDEGVNLQDLITYEPWNLNLLLGLRYSKAEVTYNSDTDWYGTERFGRFNDFDGDDWIPRVGLVWDFLPNASLFASYGESFRAQGGAPRDAGGNPLSKPETATG